MFTKHSSASPALAAAPPPAATCAATSSTTGALPQEAEDKWDDWMVEGLEIAGWIEDVCCAEKKDECCELNVGAVVGTAIALLVVLVGSILLCCKFCQGCPLNKAGGETEMTKV